MRLTAFLGSPRVGGNTDTLAQQVLDGAAQSGVKTAVFALRKLKIRPCNGCEKCWGKDRLCIHRDDMDSIYQAIIESDVLVFATPVYWYAPTAIMKAMIDRLVPFNRPQGKPLIQGKSAILITAYEEEGPTAAEPLVKMFELSFDYLGVRLIDRIVVDGVGPKGAVQGKPEALKQAFDIGRSLGPDIGGSC